MAVAPLRIAETLLSRKQLTELYRIIYLSRKLDDEEIKLKKQERIYFQISGAGHEAVLAAAGMVLKPGYDWFYPYYRDRALALALGVTPLEMLLQAAGAADDPASGGRQMPCHFGKKDLNIVSQSSPVGTQFLQALGAAEGSWYLSVVKELQTKVHSYRKDEVVYVSGGDGACSEGEFWEALNAACNTACGHQFPILFLIEDNAYAISVPVEIQTPGGSISKVIRGLADEGLLWMQEVDGTDPIKSYEVLSGAVAYIRRERRPALVQAHVIRPYSHSLSDDEAAYRPKEEREDETRRDPIRTYRKYLIDEGLAVEEELAAIEQNVQEEIERAEEQALTAAKPAKSSVTRHVYSEKIDPRSKQFDTQPEFSGDPQTMVTLINRCLADEMTRDLAIVVFGEDVADASREKYLDRVGGKGGVFKLTAGLQKRFGHHRCFNSQLAEARIVGGAVGMATRGLKPVVEIQFLDYIWPAFMQIANELSMMRWRSNGTWSCPLVIRASYGGYLRGGALYHSQCRESLFTHLPGVWVVIPSNALDASGLLRTAIRCDDPVIFLEHKHLYRQTYNRQPYPGPNYCIPFGKANLVREGKDVTIITYGALVNRSKLAADQVADQDISVEVLDLRTLIPFDWEAIAASVRKTSRVIVAHEDSLTSGFGAEIAARIVEQLFDYLDAPVMRIGALDTPVGYSPELEEAILPQTGTIAETIRKITAY